ncbi:hypothetical protein BCR32DRAFT_252050 [Anaeromyces robustus]|uniref:Uncharacterized protein n=1 Tax=Anaeromyces robustus TaxID=1754192 RepID=A0A1Y1UJI9_9FUNG|nr:hypothetical protein BCR32DRAFT_252050 [Anaeromyces robustus]|eukprot:ORX38149.1 hypothetical protein BCR32DRAFT_252050 [Anaeromyces robustus]
MNIALEKEKKIYDSEKLREIVEIKRNHMNEMEKIISTSEGAKRLEDLVKQVDISSQKLKKQLVAHKSELNSEREKLSSVLMSLEDSIKEINNRHDEEKMRMKTEENIYEKEW